MNEKSLSLDIALVNRGIPDLSKYGGGQPGCHRSSEILPTLHPLLGMPPREHFLYARHWLISLTSLFYLIFKTILSQRF